MINKEIISMVLQEEVIYIAGTDVEDLLEKILPTNQVINYMIPNKSSSKALSRTINASELADKCIIWCFKQGYNIDVSIEEARNILAEYQFRAKVTPTEYAQKAFISENPWDCVFGATEFIMNEIDEQIDDLFERA